MILCMYVCVCGPLYFWNLPAKVCDDHVMVHVCNHNMHVTDISLKQESVSIHKFKIQVMMNTFIHTYM